MHCKVCIFSSFQMESTWGDFTLVNENWLIWGIGFEALLFEMKPDRTLCFQYKHYRERWQALLKQDTNMCITEAVFLTCGSSEPSIHVLSNGNSTAFNRFLHFLKILLLQALLLLLHSSFQSLTNLNSSFKGRNQKYTCIIPYWKIESIFFCSSHISLCSFSLYLI